MGGNQGHRQIGGRQQAGGGFEPQLAQIVERRQIGDDFAVAVDIRSSLSVEDVKEHLERLDKIKKVAPRRIDLSNISLFGAVAGMIIEEGADRYAYQKGLFVLRQKGNIVEIANDEKFKPKIWKTEY